MIMMGLIDLDSIRILRSGSKEHSFEEGPQFEYIINFFDSYAFNSFISHRSHPLPSPSFKSTLSSIINYMDKICKRWE